MTTEARAAGGPGADMGRVARWIDRWIFVFMAVLFIAVVLAGFVPDSMMKIAAVEAGQRPPFPLALHAHAVVMGALLLVLLAQSVLMASGKRAWHQSLGVIGGLLAAALVVVGVILVPTMYHQLWNGAQAAPPEAASAIRQNIRGFDNIILLQIQVGLLFPILIGMALLARKTDFGLHKRLMFIAVALALPAAFDRIGWIPTTMPASPLSPHLYVVLAIAPLLLWDLVRTRKVHKAYLVWAALYAPTSILVHLLWDGQWWHATAPRLMGVG